MIPHLMRLDLEGHVANRIEARHTTEVLVGTSIKPHPVSTWLKDTTGVQEGRHTAIRICDPFSDRLEDPVALLKELLKFQGHARSRSTQANVQHVRNVPGNVSQGVNVLEGTRLGHSFGPVPTGAPSAEHLHGFFVRKGIECVHGGVGIDSCWRCDACARRLRTGAVAGMASMCPRIAPRDEPMRPTWETIQADTNCPVSRVGERKRQRRSSSHITETAALLHAKNVGCISRWNTAGRTGGQDVAVQLAIEVAPVRGAVQYAKLQAIQKRPEACIHYASVCTYSAPFRTGRIAEFDGHPRG
eukprot:scaffold370_cov349-Pavlova_lutheri.AAC.11